MTEEEASRLIAEMIKLDPATDDVVKAMRSRRRSEWSIANCFRQHMIELKMLVSEF